MTEDRAPEQVIIGEENMRDCQPSSLEPEHRLTRGGPSEEDRRSCPVPRLREDHYFPIQPKVVRPSPSCWFRVWSFAPQIWFAETSTSQT